MEKDESKKDESTGKEAPAEPGRVRGEEGIKDSGQGEDELIDNMPDSHPEPRQTKKS